MQKIIEGIASLPAVLKEISIGKLFLVTDSSYPFLSIKETIEALDVSEKVMFSDFTPNPLFEQVRVGIDLFRSSGCEAILAVGGGSAIDVAKCIKLAVIAEEGENALIPPLVLQRLPVDGSRIPFIAIPTTAGTGSESTHNAVMYYEGAKQTVTNDAILPDYAILEPSVLQTLPLYQKKCTMMDALCQGIESWWSVNSTEESKGYSRKAVELIIRNWKSYIFDNDPEAARQIMIAANYGGRAINLAQTTAAHAMSYKITSMYKLPHGHAVAVCLPEIWEYMLAHLEKCVDPRGGRYLSEVFGVISTSMGETSPEGAIRAFREMMEVMDLRNPVTDPGKRSGELDILSRSVNPIRLKNNPVGLDEETIFALYDSIIHSEGDPLISVIVPVFNVENYVEKCLESIREQTYRNLEIIVVDDGSSDGTAQICDMIAKEDPRIRVIHTPNSGVVNARNLGLDTAQGKYIGCVDGDDYLNPKTYEYLYKQVTLDADVSACCLVGVSEGNDSLMWPDYQGDGRLMKEDEILPRSVYDFDFISVAHKLYNKKVLSEIRFQEFRPEDADFNYRVFRNGVILNYSLFPGYAVRDRKSSTMRKEPISYALMSRYSHCFFYCKYHRGYSTEESRAAALNRLFMQIVKTRWDYYSTEYRAQAFETSIKMRNMLIDEYKTNSCVSSGSRLLTGLLFRSRLLYSTSIRMKGLFKGVIKKLS